MPAKRNALDPRVEYVQHATSRRSQPPIPLQSCPDSLFNTMARILITGGAYDAGSHCAKALAAAGHEGVVFDSLLLGHREFVPSGPLIQGDIGARRCSQCFVFGASV